MEDAKMTHEKPTSLPRPFRGLRVLLVDNDTSTLLRIASVLEHHSYLVTTTELATVALSILQERRDGIDLVMADVNMPEIDCFKFIGSVRLIKDFPIILMSSTLKKGVVEEAMRNGACFFLRKPISSKKLKNVWQHVYMKRRKMKNLKGNAETKTGSSDQEITSDGAKLSLR